MGYMDTGVEVGVGATLLYQKGNDAEVGVMEVKEEERHEKKKQVEFAEESERAV